MKRAVYDKQFKFAAVKLVVSENMTVVQTAHTTSFKPDINMTEKQEKKALDKFVYEFDEKVKYKQKADSNIIFEAFTKQYLENYAELQLAPKNNLVYIDKSSISCESYL